MLEEALYELKDSIGDARKMLRWFIECRLQTLVVRVVIMSGTEVRVMK